MTLLVVSSMLALRWMKENVTKYREWKAPTADSIHAIDYSRRLELFETACKVFALPMEVRHMWKERAESKEGESRDETLSEAGE